MTLFASFVSTEDARRAAAALLDRGARNEDLSLIASAPDASTGAVEIGRGLSESEQVAKYGITPTTGADAAMGAAKGLTVGLGLGVLGALAVLTIPGVGLVIGGGALAAAVGAGAATVAASAAAGGVIGYLKDQGVGDEVAARYSAAVSAGGAIVSLHLPAGDLTEVEAESLLVKYGATGVFTSYPGAGVANAPLPVAGNVVPTDLTPSGTIPVAAAVPVQGIPVPTVPVATVPVEVVPTSTVSVAVPAATIAPDVAVPIIPAAVPLGAEVPVAAVTPTRSDPISGLAPEGYVEDPLTGTRRAVIFQQGRAFYVA